MIRRDLADDITYSEPWAQLEASRAHVAASNRVWHALELPPVECGGQRRFTLTGHIVCHDCALCVEAGDFRDVGTAVPWRRCYSDCTDEHEEDGFDAFDAYQDPVTGPTPIEPEVARLLRHAFYEVEPGRLRHTGHALTELELERLDCWAMETPGHSAGRALEMPLVMAIETLFYVRRAGED